MTYPINLPGAKREPALFWSTFWDDDLLGDWRVAPAADPQNPGGLDASDQLASAVFISLFTDKRAPEGWRPEVADRRGCSISPLSTVTLAATFSSTSQESASWA